MKLLVDANLSPRIATALRDHGHDAVHVSDVGLATATDIELVTYAEADGFVVVTADTDFPMLVALRRATSPSIVLLRRVNDLSPDEHIDLLLANLPAVTDDLHRGAIVSIAPDHLRVRDLPSARRHIRVPGWMLAVNEGWSARVRWRLNERDPIHP